jgi:hypothetical protein
MKWISVKDRLPKDFEKVLVYDEDLGIESLEIVEHKQGNFSSNFYGYIKPNYWCALSQISLPDCGRIHNFDKETILKKLE